MVPYPPVDGVSRHRWCHGCRSGSSGGRPGGHRHPRQAAGAREICHATLIPGSLTVVAARVRPELLTEVRVLERAVEPRRRVITAPLVWRTQLWSNPHEAAGHLMRCVAPGNGRRAFALSGLDSFRDAAACGRGHSGGSGHSSQTAPSAPLGPGPCDDAAPPTNRGPGCQPVQGSRITAAYPWRPARLAFSGSPRVA